MTEENEKQNSLEWDNLYQTSYSILLQKIEFDKINNKSIEDIVKWSKIVANNVSLEQYEQYWNSQFQNSCSILLQKIEYDQIDDESINTIIEHSKKIADEVLLNLN